MIRISGFNGIVFPVSVVKQAAVDAAFQAASTQQAAHQALARRRSCTREDLRRLHDQARSAQRLAAALTEVVVKAGAQGAGNKREGG